MFAIYSGVNLFLEDSKLQSELEEYVNDELRSGRAEDIAVYVKNLNSGKEYGVNENEIFTPASLLKVPLMMAYLKEAEIHPELLQHETTLTQSLKDTTKGLLVYPEIKNPMKVGEKYTVEDLLTRLIKDSDNVASAILENFIPKENLIETMETVLNQKYEDNFRISPKTYSLVFESLYGQKYLNAQASEAGLQYATDTNFNAGLVSGVPKNIKVAHKYGIIERNNGQDIGLNDCGLVRSQDPYVICVMTTGHNVKVLENIISKISEVVYHEMSGTTLK